MTATLAVALALAVHATPAAACGEAVLRAAALPGEALAREARPLVLGLEAAGAGPVGAALEAADALAAARADALAREAARFRRALGRHCALLAAPRLAGPRPGDRDALAAILARPELRRASGDPRALRRAFLAAWAWLLEVLGSGEAERYASVGRALFLAAAAAAAALALLALRRRRAGAPAAGRRGAAPPRVREGATAEAALERAAAALASGEPRAAVREAFLAALAALERAGLVPPGRALTNAEVVAALAPAPPLARDVAALAALFDRTVYGARPATPEDARAALDGARRVDGLAPGAPR